MIEPALAPLFLQALQLAASWVDLQEVQQEDLLVGVFGIMFAPNDVNRPGRIHYPAWTKFINIGDFMILFKFKPIGFFRAFLSGVFYSVFLFLMFLYGFEYGLRDSAWMAIGYGFLFGLMFWFAMSMLGDGGFINKIAKKFIEN